MKQLLIVANFKSYFSLLEARQWLQGISKIKDLNLEGKKVIVCAPFTLLSEFRNLIDGSHLPLFLGAQDVSPFDKGAYTGEVNAGQLKELVEYVLIGHSERRKYFSETDEMLSKKTALVLNHGLVPIYCVQDENTQIPEGVEIVAYEPVFAIGTGNPDTPENANKVSGKIKGENIKSILYGGSVKSGNVKEFTDKENISGVLVGSASLDAEEFIKIIENV